MFFWETPLEGSDDRPVARVARVCKTDPGIRDERLTVNVFSSFVKVQLNCSSAPPPQSDTTTTKVYPFIGKQKATMLCTEQAGSHYRYHTDLSFPTSLLSPLLFPYPSPTPPSTLVQPMCSVLSTALWTRRPSLTWFMLCSRPQGALHVPTVH